MYDIVVEIFLDCDPVIKPAVSTTTSENQIQNLSSLSCVGDLKGLSPSVLRG